MPYILHVSNTPNPLAKKFHADESIAGAIPQVFKPGDDNSPVAKALFQLDGVEGLFLLDQVVTVNISNANMWGELESEIQMLLDEHLEKFVEKPKEKIKVEPLIMPDDFFGLELTAQVAHIEKILDQKVRPGLSQDGGGLSLMGIDGQSVYVYYLGACGDCPSSTSGTLNYITTQLKTYAHPEIEVELA